VPAPEVRPAAPERIGPYRILDTLGEGGMGIVYLGEQTAPIRRRVALKVIKPGMDTGQVLARFEAERQALAVMSHPNVAKVFDAGATEQGRPYFVMEYVPGTPVTEYCDMRCLPVRERLELFIQACGAIQHAHQKGIIHRDIKPSNVLVASEDGKPVLKVIDFGVAKAMGQQLTERTLFTQQGVLIGTPEYMSPEQAGRTGLDVDARTDIYSLGVLFYELLVGALPFDPAMLRRAAAVEMMRIIREEDPPKPTTKFSSLGDLAPEVARRRHTDVRSLARQLHGEVEWITLRALEKDPARRYPSASELATDLQRHLVDEPVVAGPPSAVYRLKKLVWKHRRVFAAAAAVLVALVVGLALSTALYLRSEAERRRADAEAARIRLDAEALQAALRADAEKYRSLSEQAIGLHRRALGPGNPALAPHLLNYLTVSEAVFPDMKPERLDASLREVTELIQQALDAGDTSVVRTLLLMSELDRTDERAMASLYGKAFDLVRRKAERGDREATARLGLLADLLERGLPESIPEEEQESAERTAREVLELRRKAHAPGASQLVRSLERLAVLIARKADRLQLQGDSAGAEAAYREALSLARESGTSSESRIAEIESHLGRCLFSLERFAEAEPLLIGSHRVLWAKLGDRGARTLEALNRLVDLYTAWGKREQADRYRRTLPAVSVGEVRDLGAVRFIPDVRNRGGGFSASIAGRSVWVFSDTSVSERGEAGSKWLDSSWGWAEPAASGGPPTVAGPTDGAGALLELIPLTAEEAASDAARQGKDCAEDCGSRWSLSPGPVIWDGDRGRALVFYTKNLRPSLWTERRVGVSIALWPSLDAPVVRPRLRTGAADPTLLFGADEPPWGSGALAVRDSLYAYACECKGLDCPCLLARVPLARALDREAWRFYEGRGAWSADWRTAHPVLQGTSTLSVHWNDYLGNFVAVSARLLDHRIRIRTADRPEGPWSEEAIEVEGLPSTLGYPWIRSAMGHQELSREHGRVETLTYVRNIGFLRTETRVVEIEFRSTRPRRARSGAALQPRAGALSGGSAGGEE
jgi:tRNA A-37 threonylcarbamoyl transferase component Bud32